MREKKVGPRSTRQITCCYVHRHPSTPPPTTTNAVETSHYNLYRVGIECPMPGLLSVATPVREADTGGRNFQKNKTEVGSLQQNRATESFDLTFLHPFTPTLARFHENLGILVLTPRHCWISSCRTQHVDPLVGALLYLLLFCYLLCQTILCKNLD